MNLFMGKHSAKKKKTVTQRSQIEGILYCKDDLNHRRMRFPFFPSPLLPSKNIYFLEPN